MGPRYWFKVVGILLSFITITLALYEPGEAFTCDDGRRALAERFCDGFPRPDCRDGSDEKPANFPTYPENLTSPHMSCDNKFDVHNSNKVCALRVVEFCKGIIQCVGKTYCDFSCPSHFQCPNSACWERSTVCDGNPCNDCPAFQNWNNGHGFKCVRNGRNCNLPQLFLWDDIADCDDKSDLCYTSENGDVRDIGTSSSLNERLCFQCTNDPMIISRSSVCDDFIDCPDMSDECSCNGKFHEQCSHNNKGSKPRCNCFDTNVVCYNTLDQANISCNSKNEICDKLAHCLGNSPCEYNCPSYFQCPNSACWKRSTVCDGDPCNDCPGFRHRNNGHGFKCVRNGRQCNLPQLFLWDGIADCDDKSDLCYTSENGDARDVRSSQPFNHRSCFQCKNDPMIISRSSVCDDVIDCPDKSDECFCQSGKTKDCGKFHYVDEEVMNDCSTTTTNYTQGKWRCEEWRSSRWEMFDNKLLCDGRQDCVGLIRNLDIPRLFDHDEDPQICKHRKYCETIEGLLNIPLSKVCDGFIDCKNESDEYPELCTKEGRFYCPTLNGAKISVNESDVCDLTINCDDQSDEINCTKDGRFYCENENPLFVKKEKKFNGVGDCSDWSDECPTNTKVINENIFSSRYELIANPFLRAIVWIMGMLAIAGNLVVMVMEGKTLATGESQFAAFRTNHLLILNLSVSDLLMGVYLIMLGAAGVRYSGNYCANDLIWRSSGSCTTMGVLVLLSSETSVFTMVLLTIFRLYAVKTPLNASLKQELKTVILSIILSWAFSFTIAFIPLTTQLQHLFETKAWMNENLFFDNVAVDFSSMNNFMNRFVTFQHNFTSNDSQAPNNALMRVNDANSWMDFMEILEDYNYTELFNISGYLGYYSSSSVCISKVYVTTKDKAWGYSIAIITLNFLAFMFVAIAHFWIYKKTTARQVNERPRDGRAAKQNKEIQKKILRLIITDFLCWVPISVMAFVNFGGVPMPSVMYALSAIILLPINSSLNPLIYSNAPKLLNDRIRDGLRAVFRRQPQKEQQEIVFVVANLENVHVVESETTL